MKYNWVYTSINDAPEETTYGGWALNPVRPIIVLNNNVQLIHCVGDNSQTNMHTIEIK